MKLLTEYLSTKVQSSKIKPNNKDDDEELRTIVRTEIERLGKDANLNHIDVSGCTNFTRVFYLKDFQGDISKWDVSCAINADLMFAGNPHMNLEYLGDLKFESLKIASHMFAASGRFEGKGLSNWDVSGIEKFDYMFASCKTFNEDISNWKPISAKTLDCMFKDAASFEHDLSGWQLSKYCSMIDIFKNCKMNRKHNYFPQKI